MDELGMGGTSKNAYTGMVHNPWDTNRISGGSSGGSAVLVAAVQYHLPLVLIQVIVRKPAAFNGVIG